VNISVTVSMSTTEVVNRFCYLADILSVDGSAVTARIWCG